MISAVITPHIMIDKRGSLALKTNLLSVLGVCRDGILRAVKILLDEFLQIVEGLVGCKFDEWKNCPRWYIIIFTNFKIVEDG